MRASIRWRIWRMPLLLGVLTAFGLMAALLGQGPWRVTAWLALAVPLACAGICVLRR